MPTAYTVPGVYTESVPGPQIGVASSSPTALGLVGDSVRKRRGTETIVLSGTTGVTLSQLGINTTSIVVQDPFLGTTYPLTTAYTVTTGSGKDSTPSTFDDTTSIARTASSTIPDGASVTVTYEYTDSDYFEPRVFYDFDDVRDHYGPALNDDGTISSELTLAAQFAFANGVSRVVCVAAQHSGAGAATVAEYTSALAKLDGIPIISVVAFANGNKQLHSVLLDHVIRQSAAQRERRGVAGFDGTGTAVNTSERQAAARAIANQRIAMTSPDKVQYFHAKMNRNINIGGHFLAVAVAALSIAQLSSIPLTRKRIFGFAGLTENLSEAAKTAESQAGLLVIEQVMNGNLRIRHGVTTNPATLETREWSITGQQDSMVYRIRDYLDNSNLIGSTITPATLAIVKGTVDGALERLVQDDVILQYANLKVRTLGDPQDTIEVRFDWRPSMPLNFIVVRFSINLSTGEMSNDINVGQ